jgi:DNA-directed RNA polymerase subunit beta'
MSKLENGRIMSSPFNELYRAVILRNSKVRRMTDIQAPALILNNERRLLQMTVDALLDHR